VADQDGWWWRTLVDAGFYRQKFVEQWKPTSYARPTDALKAALGISPEDVTDGVLSHVHWDHGDGADLFPQARIWIQRAEYEHYVGDRGTVLDRGIDTDVAAMLFTLQQEGRLRLVDGDRPRAHPAVLQRFPAAGTNAVRID
jgi:glyoxylase-like metal-dependent hydrolase (beta-lactamase superfamily II)